MSITKKHILDCTHILHQVPSVSSFREWANNVGLSTPPRLWVSYLSLYAALKLASLEPAGAVPRTIQASCH
ncbi:hypothetical protein CEXT_58441 [Caerostris extrusa]|uniref:Uncharacterized protein n=1 Tax=Caerostris extrusa TaxID=172846 RepID=A0AAV4RIY2_CAEEX|nr:hypothetical protein CEXT_58441 [Caerostris extrusa]